MDEFGEERGGREGGTWGRFRFFIYYSLTGSFDYIGQVGLRHIIRDEKVWERIYN